MHASKLERIQFIAYEKQKKRQINKHTHSRTLSTVSLQRYYTGTPLPVTFCSVATHATRREGKVSSAVISARSSDNIERRGPAPKIAHSNQHLNPDCVCRTPKKMGRLRRGTIIELKISVSLARSRNGAGQVYIYYFAVH